MSENRLGLLGRREFLGAAALGAQTIGGAQQAENKKPLRVGLVPPHLVHEFRPPQRPAQPPTSTRGWPKFFVPVATSWSARPSARRPASGSKPRAVNACGTGPR